MTRHERGLKMMKQGEGGSKRMKDHERGGYGIREEDDDDDNYDENDDDDGLKTNLTVSRISYSRRRSSRLNVEVADMALKNSFFFFMHVKMSL